MRWASAVSTAPDLQRAVSEAADQVRGGLDRAPSLTLAFASGQYGPDLKYVPELLLAELGKTLVMGCSAGGVIGGGREIEHEPALALTAAVLPGVDVRPFFLDRMPAGSTARSWTESLGVPAGGANCFVLLPDPFTFESEPLLRGLDTWYPDAVKIGGLASGASEPGSSMLFLERTAYRTGVVGVALAGDVRVDTVVAQGCRPIGEPMFVTRSDRNMIWQLDGEPAVTVLRDLYERLSPSDQALARHSLFLGIVMSEGRQEYHQGDFLIRNLVGIEISSGTVAVGAVVPESSIVQFHLRDAHTSAQDLHSHLARYGASGSGAPHGALLFSCLGRGKGLYGRPDHDSEVFREHLGDVPMGGFFCNGEIGPVNRTTFLHGYTSSFALFRPR